MDRVGSLFLGLRNRFNHSQMSHQTRVGGYQPILSEEPQDQQTPVQDSQSPENHGRANNSISQVTLVPLPPQSLSDMEKIVDQFMVILKSCELNEDFSKIEAIFFEKFSIFSKKSLKNKEEIMNLLWRKSNLDDEKLKVISRFMYGLIILETAA